MITLGEAGALNSAVYAGPEAPLPQGWATMEFIEDTATGLTMAHYAQGPKNYLAVRGTWSRTDVVDALRVFLGVDPADRIDLLRHHIIHRFGPHPEVGRLAVGGHSLGGLVAATAAEHFHLPGLAQNSPGWMTRTPNVARLDRFLQVRTARDVVADWGTGYPRNLMLPDPHLPAWEIKSLHNLEHQNRLIQEYGLAHRRVDDPTLAPVAVEVCQSPASPFERLSRAAARWRTGREYTELHERLGSHPKL